MALKTVALLLCAVAISVSVIPINNNDANEVLSPKTPFLLAVQNTGSGYEFGQLDLASGEFVTLSPFDNPSAFSYDINDDIILTTVTDSNAQNHYREVQGATGKILLDVNITDLPSSIMENREFDPNRIAYLVIDPSSSGLTEVQSLNTSASTFDTTTIVSYQREGGAEGAYSACGSKYYYVENGNVIVQVDVIAALVVNRITVPGVVNFVAGDCNGQVKAIVNGTVFGHVDIEGFVTHIVRLPHPVTTIEQSSPPFAIYFGGTGTLYAQVFDEGSPVLYSTNGKDTVSQVFLKFPIVASASTGR